MAAQATQIQFQTDQQVFLAGRPPLGEFLGFVTTQTVDGATADVSALADQWRAANDHVKQIEQDEAGWADDPTVEEISAELGALRDQALSDPIVQESFGMTPMEIGVVELDRLVVFQKHINVTYTQELGRMLGDDPSEEDVFRFCLPIDRRYDPPTRVGPISFGPKGPNAWAFVSPSMDYRVLETRLLDPSQVSGLRSSGAPTEIVAVVMGYGSNYLSAMSVNGRLVLRNGSHRAFSLRDSGRTHAPVLIQTISRPEELELFLPPEVYERRELYLESPRPPVLKDYFDDQLRKIVEVPRTMRQVQVGVNYGETSTPA